MVFRSYVSFWLTITLAFVAWIITGPDRSGFATEIPSGSDFRVFEDQPAANDFAMATLDGNQLRLSDLKGSVVILNFWRRDCQYCAMEKGHLKSMVQTLNRPDLKVVCVNFWDSPTDVKAYAKKVGDDLMVAARPDGSRCVVENTVRGRLMGYYVLNEAGDAIYEVKGFPSTYVIDKEGHVIAGHVGMAQWASPSVRNWISGLAGTERPDNTVAPDQYQLPLWIDRLLSAAPHETPSLGVTNGRRAQVGPTN